jgi:hypothetical protein
LILDEKLEAAEREKKLAATSRAIRVTTAGLKEGGEPPSKNAPNQ